MKRICCDACPACLSNDTNTCFPFRGRIRRPSKLCLYYLSFFAFLYSFRECKKGTWYIYIYIIAYSFPICNSSTKILVLVAKRIPDNNQMHSSPLFCTYKLVKSAPVTSKASTDFTSSDMGLPFL